MVRLRRCVRFCVNPPQAPHVADAHNGYAGRPSMSGLGRFYALDVAASGDPDPITGYLLNIKDLDRAAHSAGVPVIERACEERPAVDPATVMPEVVAALADALGGAALESVRWSLTPYYSVEMTPADTTHVTIRQSFDFAAAHRLHVASLSDEENRATFGHCNNPAGHGHNYRIEPAVRVALDTGGPAFTLADLERVTDDVILQRFDHTHLNQDTPEFRAESGGVTPSVENIARVFFELLAPAIAERSGADAELRSITVWETDRTSCTYPG
jgi:6-pyruvoyltetrahydropterin/6-carboxytetrahydropterin synthase